MITSNLFHQEFLRKKQARKQRTETTDAAEDPITRLFGTVMPASIPESIEGEQLRAEVHGNLS